MTLVIAQRQKDKLSFSSDSRFTLGPDSYFNSGIKVFNIPFRLKGPISSIEDRDKWEFQYTYGLAITGSSMNAYTVKESIAEVLANLQYMSNTSDVSIIGIGQLILKVYEDVSTQLSQVVREAGLSEILVAGYCLRGKRVRFLRFYPVIEDTVTYRFEEVLLEDGLAFFGSGRKLGEKIYESDKALTPLQIIKKAIDSKKNQLSGACLNMAPFIKTTLK